MRGGWLSTGITLSHPSPDASAAAGDVQFNTAASYSLTLQLTDMNGLSDTAAVTIAIIETNDPASWVGTYTTGGAAAPTTTAYGPATPVLSVSEAASVGTVFGRVLASDPNRGAVWGARIYSLIPSADTRFFGINSTSGELLVAAPGAAFWDQPNFFFVVTVQDADPVAPLVVPYNVSVQLVQVNTVSVSGFAVPAGTLATAGLNASAAVTSPLYASYVTPAVDALLTTRGLPNLVVFGAGFGRTAARLSREGVALTPAGIAAATSVSATIGAWTVAPASWAPVACVVVVPNTVLSCAVPAGVGANLSIAVNVAGWPALSSRAVSYMPPSITSAARVGGGALLTEGTDSVVLTGDNFGPAGTQPLVSYAVNATTLPLLYAPSATCVVSTAHSALVCPTVPGVGKGLLFSVSVAGQPSAPGIFSPSPQVQYQAPTITAVTAPLLQTAGGESGVIRLTGELETPRACIASQKALRRL